MIHAAPPSDAAPSLPTLRGTQPGLLDPSQPSRLLRFPDSKLSFASFDPKTALVGEPVAQKHNNSGALTPPKRVVIETTANGVSFWRFVPRARLEQGVQDEGIWPRAINICGKIVQCYLEQWEIYKLDPNYHCVVYPWPKCSAVTRVELPNQEFESTDPDSGKRSRWSSPEASGVAAQKKARSCAPDETEESDFDSDKDEDEVEKMIIDESSSQKPRSDRRSNVSSREKINRVRRERWAKNRTAYEKRVQETTFPAEGSFSMRVDSDDTVPSQNIPSPTEEGIKRKGNLFPESDNDSDRMSCDQSPRRYKRARTSPLKPLKGVSQNRVPYSKKRLNRLRGYGNFNLYDRNFAEFLRSAFVPPELVDEEEAEGGTRETFSQDNDCSEETPPETSSSREAEVAESIRKLRELEKDRPIWEEQRKKREARERAEEQEGLAKAERRRKEEEQRLRQQREAAEQERRRAQQEAERVTREEELRQREIRRRQRQRWESGLWTTYRALERYRMLSDEFDSAKFTCGQSITFHDIPWPVLQAPSRLTVEDVDWSAVETFFATVKSHMRLQDYKAFVEKSHRRFHPDRWRARKIWVAVTDEVERGYMEVAANTVAQAITPIWRAVKEQ